MSIFPLQLQVVSDLHLETPLLAPSYTKYSINVEASNLCIMGDIGLVKDDALFTFLRKNLEQSRGHRIFYVIGNYEAYQLSFDDAVNKLRAFEEEARMEFGGRFILLHRNRYDLDATTTLLGCPLWSAISPKQANEAQIRLTDFNEQHGIRGWSLESHLTHHQGDLDWLNQQIQELQTSDRNIAILTHHSPTMDPRATSPRHQGSSQSTCFATDLSTELCWTSPIVKLWAFGHTHYNCSFRDDVTGKLIIANQGGYRGPKQTRIKTMVVELAKSGWEIKDIKSNSQEFDGEGIKSNMRKGDGKVTNRDDPNVKRRKGETSRVLWIKKIARFFRRSD